MAKPKIDKKSVIERCILRSKHRLLAQSVQHTRKEQDLFLNRIPTNTLVSIKSFSEFDKELLVLIDGWERDIANFLKPITTPLNIEIGDRFWFSSADMKSGYVALSSNAMKQYGVDDYALLLSDIPNTDYSAGMIVRWEDVIKHSSNIKGVIDKSFVTHYMLRKL